MQISIDLDDKTPPFEQIKMAIIEIVAVGQLPSGHQLPTIRQLAGDLGVAPNTVARAYRELESIGVLRSRGRRGTTVVGLPATVDTAVDPLCVAVVDARRQGQSSAQIIASVMQALAT